MKAEVDPGLEMINIHVCDTGPGISDEVLANLFNNYWHGNYRMSNSNAHLGLGLNIVAEIVRAHHGTIHAANLPDGSEFYFSLPIYRNQV